MNLKWLRKLIFCSRDIHCRVEHEDGSILGIGSAGHCLDCGKKWDAMKWDRATMPSCTPVKKEIIMPLKKQIDGNHYTSLKIQPLELSYLIAGGDTCFTLAAKYLLRDKYDANGKSLRPIDLNKAIHSIELGASQITTPLRDQQYKKVNDDVACSNIFAYAHQATSSKGAIQSVLWLMWWGKYNDAIAQVKMIAEIEGIELI